VLTDDHDHAVKFRQRSGKQIIQTWLEPRFAYTMVSPYFQR
jgi:hypothetical protein